MKLCTRSRDPSTKPLHVRVTRWPLDRGHHFRHGDRRVRDCIADINDSIKSSVRRHRIVQESSSSRDRSLPVLEVKILPHPPDQINHTMAAILLAKCSSRPNCKIKRKGRVDSLQVEPRVSWRCDNVCARVTGCRVVSTSMNTN